MKLPCFTILFLERLTKCWTNWAFQQVDVKLCVSCHLNFISLVARHFIPKIFNRKLFEHRLFRQSVFKNNPCSRRYIFRFWLVKVVSVVPRVYLPTSWLLRIIASDVRTENRAIERVEGQRHGDQEARGPARVHRYFSARLFKPKLQPQTIQP